jgi:integrase
MPLTDLAVRSAKPRLKEYKLSDQFGLYLLVRPNGSKVWNQAYRYADRQKKLTHGAYPVVSLAEARELRESARKLLEKGIDPAVHKHEEKLAAVRASQSTFDAVGADWIEDVRNAGRTAAKTIERYQRMRKIARPSIGKLPVSSVTTAMVSDLVSRVERSGRYETAAQLLSCCGHIFRYAITKGHRPDDPAYPLRGQSRGPQAEHRAAIKQEVSIGPLIRGLRTYEGHFVTRYALQIMAYTFPRTDELRWAAKVEFDLDAAMWQIPPGRMKAVRGEKRKAPHYVPLAPQVVKLLRELFDLVPGDLAFPSMVKADRPIGENALLQALRRLGYTSDEMTGHGFRSMASTRLNELGFSGDWIERQLAHKDDSKARRAYNAAEYLPGRITLMNAWADYLDRLATEDENLIG